MEQRELYAKLPNNKPFDTDAFFPTFLGSFVLPLLSSQNITRYWFTQYGSPGNRQIRFRYELASFAQLQPQFDNLVAQSGLTVLNSADFDVVGDLSGMRFLGTNQRQKDYRARAEMIFDFLHATARLYIDTLSHCDANGYWQREDNKDLGNNDKGDSFETYHHLLCNMTSVPTEGVYAEVKETGKTGVFSRLYFKITREELRPQQKTLAELQSLGHIQF
jgi:hypothetical protein